MHSTLLIPPGSKRRLKTVSLTSACLSEAPLTERNACGTRRRQHSFHPSPEYSHTQHKNRRRIQIIWTVFNSSKPNYVKKLSFLKFFPCTPRFFETCSSHADRFPAVMGIKPSHLSPALLARTLSIDDRMSLQQIHRAVLLEKLDDWPTCNEAQIQGNSMLYTTTEMISNCTITHSMKKYTYQACITSHFLPLLPGLSRRFLGQSLNLDFTLSSLFVLSPYKLCKLLFYSSKL